MRALRFLAVGSFVACGADSITTADVPGRLESQHVWSGGTVRIVVPSLPLGAPIPLAIVGSDTVDLVREDDSTLSAPVPDTNGLVALHLVGVAGVDAIWVHGFEGYEQSVSVDGLIHAWPQSGTATALAIHGGRASRIDFTAGTALALGTELNLVSQCLAGPVPSADDPTLIVTSVLEPAGTCGRLHAWRLGTSVVVDSGPAPNYYWPVIRLSAGHWLVSYKSWFQTYSLQPDLSFATSSPIPCNKPTGFRISPLGDRVIPINCTPVTGPTPVFDSQTGAIAYYAPGAVEGATFSPSGDTLFASVSGGNGSVLYALRSGTGQILGSAPVSTTGLTLEADATGHWLFVATLADTVPIVRVLNARTLQLVATLRRPSGTEVPFGEYRFQQLNWQMLTNRVAAELLLVFGGNTHGIQGVSDSPTYLYRFSLVP